MSVLAPYIPVAEKAASLATQLAAGQMANIEIEYLGDIANHDTAALKAAVIKGLLEPVSEENVTIVNANLVAESRGMKIVERKGPGEDVYANLIRVHIHTSAGNTDVTGTLAHDGPHIVAINDFWVDIPPGRWLAAPLREPGPPRLDRRRRHLPRRSTTSTSASCASAAPPSAVRR